MISLPADRVQRNSAARVNETIRREAEQRIACAAKAGPEAIARRLRELDEEWDVERYLETVAPTLTLTGIVLGLARDRRWFLLPMAVQSFFLMHAVQGWCPPLPVLRAFGVRTQREIDSERYALEELRGNSSGDKRNAGTTTRRPSKTNGR